MPEADWTPAGLWLAVVVSGVYHGLNPGMGWPLAVSAGLLERDARALLAALGPLTLGHLLAILLVILPFALLLALVEWRQPIQIVASLIVIAFGVFACSTSAIRACWRAFRRPSLRYGHLLLRSPMAPD